MAYQSKIDGGSWRKNNPAEIKGNKLKKYVRKLNAKR